jgi:hypothetical protein
LVVAAHRAPETTVSASTTPAGGRVGDDRQLPGIDLWLDEARSGTLTIETNVVSGEVSLASLADDTITLDGGGLSASSPSITCRRTTGAGRFRWAMP